MMKKSNFLKRVLGMTVLCGLLAFTVSSQEPVKTEDLLDRKTRFKELRQMAMELSYRYSNEKQAEIGAIFGIDYSTVSQSRTRLKAKLKSSRKLNKQFKQIKEQVMKLSI